MLFAKRIPITDQMIIHPITILTNIHIHSKNTHGERASHDCKSQRTIRKRATDVPSLNNDSPSISKLRRRGTQSCLKILRTATGSVAEIIIPKRTKTDTGTSRPMSRKIRYHSHAITAVERESPSVAISQIAHLFFMS